MPRRTATLAAPDNPLAWTLEPLLLLLLLLVLLLLAMSAHVPLPLLARLSVLQLLSSSEECVRASILTVTSRDC